MEKSELRGLPYAPFFGKGLEQVCSNRCPKCGFRNRDKEPIVSAIANSFITITCERCKIKFVGLSEEP